MSPRILILYDPQGYIEPPPRTQLPAHIQIAMADLAQLPETDDELRAAVDRLMTLLLMVDDRAPLDTTPEQRAREAGLS